MPRSSALDRFNAVSPKSHLKQARISLGSAGLLVATILSASACAAQVDELSQIETAVASTMQVEAELAGTVGVQVELTVSALATVLTPPVPSETPTPTPVPTETPTPTPAVVTISVSSDTNCRTGPAAVYDNRGSLRVGETSEVVATSTEPDYFYIANPDRPGEFCWLWGQYATVAGDTVPLPVLTPMPRPTSAPAFTLQLYDFYTCVVDYAVFKIHNTGPVTFMTADRHILDLETSSDIFGPELDRHPFAPGPSDCPPGHDNRLAPDQVAFIYVEFDPEASGHGARATIRVCTEDYLGGVCFAQSADFTVP